MVSVASLRARLAHHGPHLLRETVRVAEAPGAVRGALRLGLTTLVALGVLAALGRLDLGVYATFGAFAGVYGGRAPRPGRWRTQAAMGGLLLGVVLLGWAVSLSPQRLVWAVPVAAGVAGVTGVASLRRGWLPPGPFFATFAVATCAAVPSTVGRLPLVVAATAGTAAVVLLLGWTEERVWPVAPPPGGPREGSRSDPVRAGQRAAYAVLAAGVVALVSGIGHPYWAMVAAAATLSGASTSHRLVRALQRGLGTAAGLLPAWVLLALPLPLVTVPVTAAVLQTLVELLIPRNYALALVFVTPLALLVVDAAHPEPALTLVADRFVETVIGLACASIAIVLLRDRRDRVG